jgi:uncharacterized CHY-type Zn-finger protein
MRVIHGLEVYGKIIDDATRCSHYNSPLDIVAIKLKCCGRWFPCRECHDNLESHAAEVWPKDRFDTLAILCGECGHRLTINSYLACNSICPTCNAAFNPRCADHYQLYFEI